jgi:hypothetical protein
MSAKHLLRAAFAGAVLLGVSLYDAKPTHGRPVGTTYGQLTTRSIDRTDVPWQASVVEDLDHIRSF